MKNRAESNVLVKGPAVAIFPAVSLSKKPDMITAPGEIILKNGRKIERRVIIAPKRVNRNSAHNPKRCADNLWASSCTRKAEVNTTARLTNISGVIEWFNSICKTIDSPTPITSTALTARWRISTELNRNRLSEDGGG